MEQLMFGGFIKAVIAAIGTFCVEILFGDVVIFGIFFLFAILDLILGITYAKVKGDYDPYVAFFWVRKALSYIIFAMFVGVLFYSWFRMSGVVVYATNFILFGCTVTEAASVFAKMKKLGMPVPPGMDYVMKLLRNNSAKHITSKINDPEMRAEIEKALANDPTTASQDGD